MGERLASCIKSIAAHPIALSMMYVSSTRLMIVATDPADKSVNWNLIVSSRVSGQHEALLARPPRARALESLGLMAWIVTRGQCRRSNTLSASPFIRCVGPADRPRRLRWTAEDLLSGRVRVGALSSRERHFQQGGRSVANTGTVRKGKPQYPQTQTRAGQLLHSSLGSSFAFRLGMPGTQQM